MGPMRLSRWRPGGLGGLHATLFRRTTLGSSCGLPRLEHRGHLGESALAELRFHTDDVDQLAQGTRHARGKVWVRVEHGWDGFDRPTLVE
jgi:hypothetical protein